MGSSVGILENKEKLALPVLKTSTRLSKLRGGYHVRNQPIKDRRQSHVNHVDSSFNDVEDEELSDEIMASLLVKGFLGKSPQRRTLTRVEVTFEQDGHTGKMYNIEAEDYQAMCQLNHGVNRSIWSISIPCSGQSSNVMTPSNPNIDPTSMIRVDSIATVQSTSSKSDAFSYVPAIGLPHAVACSDSSPMQPSSSNYMYDGSLDKQRFNGSMHLCEYANDDLVQSTF
jgi:hypothetical protein